MLTEWDEDRETLMEAKERLKHKDCNESVN